MKLNTSTTILIIILLLIMYLLDNIKSYEDNLLSYYDIKSQDLNPRKKYFQKLHFKTPTVYKKEKEVEEKKENIDINDILKINNNKINIEIPLEKSKPKQDEYVVIPSMDKYISGEKSLGDTVMMVKSETEDEIPVNLDLEKIFSQQ